MATRKKKTEVIMSADIAEMMESKVVKGSHLTITYKNGYPEKLEWDDEALARDVRGAIASVEFADIKPAVKDKVITRKKKEKT
jgi:hypothetical protein